MSLEVAKSQIIYHQMWKSSKQFVYIENIIMHVMLQKACKSLNLFNINK